MKQGLMCLLQKPFNVASLDARIRQLLDVRTAIKENIRKELIIDLKKLLSHLMTTNSLLTSSTL